MGIKPKYISQVPAVEQASRILLCLAQDQSGSRTLTDICKQVGICKSKGYSILNTLQHFGFVQRDPESKSYSLGTSLLFLSAKVLSSMDLRTVAAPFLKRLAQETNSTAFLGVVAAPHLIVAAKDEGDQDIGITIRLGHRFPLAWGAHGKAIAAFLPEAERSKLLDGARLFFHGSPSNLDRRRLARELVQCRSKGFAADMEEMKTGIRAVAAPVFGPGGRLLGCVTVVGTFSKESAGEFGRMVSDATRKLSRNIGGLPGGP